MGFHCIAIVLCAHFEKCLPRLRSNMLQPWTKCVFFCIVNLVKNRGTANRTATIFPYVTTPMLRLAAHEAIKLLNIIFQLDFSLFDHSYLNCSIYSRWIWLGRKRTFNRCFKISRRSMVNGHEFKQNTLRSWLYYYRLADNSHWRTRLFRVSWVFSVRYWLNIIEEPDYQIKQITT